MRAYPALRTVLTADGRLETRSKVPSRWSIPALGLLTEEEVGQLRDELTGRAFPLGVWPPFELRTSRTSSGWLVHCAFDLAVLDARSVHLLCRELFTTDELRAPHAAPAPATEADWGTTG
jgi:hypothetical protein